METRSDVAAVFARWLACCPVGERETATVGVSWPDARQAPPAPRRQEWPRTGALVVFPGAGGAPPSRAQAARPGRRCPPCARLALQGALPALSWNHAPSG